MKEEEKYRFEYGAQIAKPMQCGTIVASEPEKDTWKDHLRAIGIPVSVFIILAVVDPRVALMIAGIGSGIWLATYCFYR